MTEQPMWYDEELMRDGILIIGVYFKKLKDNFQNDARRWLGETLINKLKEEYPELLEETRIEPLEYALTRYISPVSKKGRRGRTKGGEYKYLIENATPNFYEKLFDILEQEKQKGPEWFNDYYILVARRVIKDE